LDFIWIAIGENAWITHQSGTDVVLLASEMALMVTLITWVREIQRQSCINRLPNQRRTCWQKACRCCCPASNCAFLGAKLLTGLGWKGSAVFGTRDWHSLRGGNVCRVLCVRERGEVHRIEVLRAQPTRYVFAGAAASCITAVP
jgi:hypothetical protein